MSKRSSKPGRAFFEAAPGQDLSVQKQRQAKLLNYVGALAGIDELFGRSLRWNATHPTAVALS